MIFVLLRAIRLKINGRVAELQNCIGDSVLISFSALLLIFLFLSLSRDRTTVYRISNQTGGEFMAMRLRASSCL